MKMNDSKSIRLTLIEEMRHGEFSDCDRLPRELVLAERFHVSRNHLREVLAQLESEGFITRRHGVGTIINHHVLQVRNRMDIETEFLDIIRQSGYEADVSHIDVREERASDYVAQKLQVSAGTEIICVYRVCTADGKPAIYCEDVIEKGLVKGDYDAAELKEPIFHFLQKYCGIEAYMDLTQLHAAAADQTVAEALQVPEGTPLLNMEEVDYDMEGNIVFFSSQYFIDEVFEQTVLRKKL